MPAERSRRAVASRVTALPALLVTLALLAGCGQAAGGPAATVQGRGDGDRLHGTRLDDPYEVPSVALTNTEGQPTRLTGREADLTLVFFGYTHCPDICNVVMGSLASAMTRLSPADRQRVEVVFITTDPARDDRQRLRTYLDRFNPRFIGLTGTLEEITRVAKPLGVAIRKGKKLPSGGYEVIHGTQVIGVRPDGTAPVLWTDVMSAAQFAEDIHRLLTKGST